MLEQIFFVVIVLAVASLMAVDVARTRHDASHGLAEGQVSDARRPVAAGVVIIVVALASLLTIAVARSVLQPLYRLRLGAQELTGPRLADAVRRASQNSASQSNGNRDGAPFGLRPVDVDAFDEIGEV